MGAVRFSCTKRQEIVYEGEEECRGSLLTCLSFGCTWNWEVVALIIARSSSCAHTTSCKWDHSQVVGWHCVAYGRHIMFLTLFSYPGNMLSSANCSSQT